ncbi:hypothetical protein VTH06DRAFT_2624 [Thermothelomyces fergusii]
MMTVVTATTAGVPAVRIAGTAITDDATAGNVIRHGRRTAGPREAETGAGTTAAGGMTPATGGAVVTGPRTPSPGEVTAHALVLPERMAPRARMARCVWTPGALAGARRVGVANAV